MNGTVHRRILHVGNVRLAETNGVHRSIDVLTKLIVDNGHTAGVLHFSRSATKVREATHGAVPIITIPVKGMSGRAGAHVQFLTGRGKKDLSRVLAEWDVLHLHSVFQVDHTFVGSSGVPFVITPHGGYAPQILNGPKTMAKQLWFATRDRPMLRRASVVQTLAASETRRVLELEPKSNVQELPIPMVASKRRSSFHLAPDGPLVFIGRIDIRHKGLDLLFRALGQLESDVRPQVVVAGPAPTATMEELNRLIADYGLGRYVSFPGAVGGQVKDELLASARWFIHTSRWEGLPLSMLEAAAVGVPLLASDATNLGSRILKSGAGLRCDGTVAGITQMLREAVGTDDDRHRKYSAGAIELSNEFTPEAVWPSYEQLYGIGTR